MHPYRFKKDGKSTPYVSPHYHSIAFGWIDGNKVKEVYEKYGIVVKKIRTVETKKIFPLAKYLLTHAGVKERTHGVVYTGSLSYSKLKLPKDELEPIICPYCPLELSLIRLDPQYLDRPPPFRPGFIGLTSFSGFEYITDYDYHFYDSKWNMISSKQVRLVNQYKQEKLNQLQQKKQDKQDRKSRMCNVLEKWIDA